VFWASSDSKSSLAGLSFLMFMMSLFVCAVLVRLEPHVYTVFNMAKVASFAFITWVYLCAFFNALSENGNIGSYLLILLIVLIPASMFLSYLVSRARPPEFEELQLQAAQADHHGRIIERKFGDDRFVKNWCSRYHIDIEKCAHFFYRGPQTVRDFLDVIGLRHDLQAIFIKGSKTNLRTEKDAISVDDLESIRSVITLNKDLKAFSINGHRLREDHVNVIISFLHLNNSITLLDLFDNDISTQVALKLITDLQVQTHIEELNLGENNIDADGRTLLKAEQEKTFPNLKLML